MEKDTKILLTEDDSGHAYLIKRYLKQSGIDSPIIHFSDGQEVLDFLFGNGSGPHCKEHTPYILLLDLKLPVVGGFAVMERLNKDTELSKIPVIVISTSDNQEEVEKCKNLGCIRFIKKPVNPEEFAKEMERLARFLIDIEVPRIP